MISGQNVLSRRERQIMDILYAKEEASAMEVREALPDPPSYSAVRAMLRLLEQKGHLKHRVEQQRYIYSPVIEKRRARRSALNHLVETFFEGSVEQAVVTLVDASKNRLSAKQYERLIKAIEKAQKEGR